MAGDEDGRYISQVQSPRIRHDSRLAVHDSSGAHPVQSDFCITDPMPTWFKNGRVQNNAGASVVVNRNSVGEKGFDSGDIKGASRFVPDGNKFTDSKRFTVLLVISGVGVGLRPYGSIGQEIRYDSLIASLGGILSRRICGVAQTFNDSAGASPGRDVFGAAPSLKRSSPCTL